MLGTMRKRPGDQLDYDVDFGRWLSADDAIQDASAEASGVTVERVEVFSTVVKVWLSGGEAGGSHEITVTVSTAHGRVKSAAFNLRVTEC